MVLLPEINSLILKDISGIIYCFTVCNSRKTHLSVIVIVVGVRLEVIVAGEVVVLVVVVAEVVVIILLCKKCRFMFGGVCVCVVYIFTSE